jgi:hypothetical protein
MVVGYKAGDLAGHVNKHGDHGQWTYTYIPLINMKIKFDFSNKYAD